VFRAPLHPLSLKKSWQLQLSQFGFVAKTGLGEKYSPLYHTLVLLHQY
jgi:hypothetical protein